jgi:beta-hydroxylase
LFKRQELYGWKGYAQLVALFAFQGLLALLFGVTLLGSDGGSRSSLSLLLVAGALPLLSWQWHLLLPTLVRFELVFMPKLERRLLLPLVAASTLAASIAAAGPAEVRSAATQALAATVLLLGLMSFALAGLLFLNLRSERQALARMSELFATFRQGRAAVELERIERYLEQRRRCLTPGMPIRGLEFPGLTSRPWHDPSSFAWTALLEQAYPAIRDEVLAAVAEPSRLAQYDYVGVSTSSWKSLMLLCEPNGFVSDNCARFPKTMATLRSLPITPAREVMVSVLAPHARIPPHRDSGNMTLTCQLGIQIPAQSCGIRVGREAREWTAGKTIVFDTAYEHEVWNDSDQTRIVFLFDFLHPDLTEIEQTFFRQWALLRRVVPALDAVAPEVA